MIRHLIIIIIFALNINAQTLSPTAHWNFDTDKKGIVKDVVSGMQDSTFGYVAYKNGVIGKSLKFDAKSTYILRDKNNILDLSGGQFTVEAWIAQQAYPLNWAPVFEQKTDETGFFFGVDSDGRFGLHIALNGKWYTCNSHAPFEGYETFHTWDSDKRKWMLHDREKESPIPLEGKGNPTLKLLKWNHIVGVYNSNSGIKIYLNGKLEGELEFQGYFEQAVSPLIIGKQLEPVYPAHTERFFGTQPLTYSLDGLIDELKIYNVSLNESQIKEAYQTSKPDIIQPLEFRKIPTGPAGPGKFGAYYTFLNYDEDFDRNFRMKESPDVVVMFDKYPFKLVSWHGLNYYPIWYSENDIGLSHEAVETWGNWGCHEALMDKQVRYANMRILESNDARVVLHFRHAVNNMEYELIHEDSISGWHDWCDEILTIYPDGVAARNLIHWCSYLQLAGSKDPIFVEDFVEELDKYGNPLHNNSDETEIEKNEDEEEHAQTKGEPHTYEQDNFIVPIGKTPSDILNKEGGIHANMDGEESNYNWEYSGLPRGKRIENPNIVVYNIKAESKPFMIVPPAASEHFFEGNGKPWPHSYYWWDHWPVDQLKSDGKQLHLVNGRPSSTCIGSASFKLDTTVFKYENNSISVFSLIGMGMNIRAGELLPLAKSWINPPELILENNSYLNNGYSKEGRCYKITAVSEGDFQAKFEISENSSLVNPAIVIDNWGNNEVELRINNEIVNRGEKFRYSLENDLYGKTKLILWIEYNSKKNIFFELKKLY